MTDETGKFLRTTMDGSVYSVTPSRLLELHHENLRLKQRLEEVRRTAAANEKIWRQFLEIERILFRTREFSGLARHLLQEIKERFGIDWAVLFLSHPDLGERFFPDLAEGGEEVSKGTWIASMAPQEAMKRFNGSLRPVFLPPAEIDVLTGVLAGRRQDPARSGLLLPLTVHDLFFGCLFLGSSDPDHYRPKDGTELLEQLGIKIALCMDNCLAYERVKDLSDRDRVTGLLNFFQIHTVLERELRRARRMGKPLSVLAVNLDFVDEGSGHVDLVGPVLRHVSGLLMETLPEGDGFIGRTGSVEFVVILPYAALEEARRVAEKLSELIRKSPFRHDNAVILIRVRIGAASLRDHMSCAQDVLDAAQTDLCGLKAGQI